MTQSQIYDARPCVLGEGPLWHPGRAQLFWFDVLGNRLLAKSQGQPKEWHFGENVSAAGWIDTTHLLIASESGLFRFNLETGKQDLVVALEADNPLTRSNDGRADPWGGFWIGTMGKQAEPNAGAIYRWFQGRLEPLFHDVTIPNAICFSPDRTAAYFTDTPTRQIMRQALDQDGWPTGIAEVFVDLNRDALNPDGAIVDQQGCLWNAQWGASRVARYSPTGTLLCTVEFPAEQTSCPSLGGPEMETLFVTSAAGGADPKDTTAGQTFSSQVGVMGQKEHQVAL